MSVAVFDIGKTNIKLSLLTSEGHIIDSRSIENRRVKGEHYDVIDLKHAESFLFNGLCEFAAVHTITDIISTTHGCLGFIILDDGSIYALPDYEQHQTLKMQPDYPDIADDYPARGSQPLEGFLHTTQQIMLWKWHNPEAFKRAQFLLMGPQFWAWRLCGVPASEVTMLGALTHLWDVSAQTYAPIVDRMGWRRLLPEIRSAGDILGLLSESLSRDLGLIHRPKIRCGIHDSSANFYRYQASGLDFFTLLSSGTWLVGLSNERAISDSDEALGISLNADSEGQPLICALAMAGREYALIRGTQEQNASLEDVLSVINHHQYALPGFVDNDGFFPGSALKGHLANLDLDNLQARRGVAVLYIALCADLGLELMGSKSTVIVDGSFAKNKLFINILSLLRPHQSIQISDELSGTSVGAALVTGHQTRQKHLPLYSTAVLPAEIPGLLRYRAEWRELCSHHLYHRRKQHDD